MNETVMMIAASTLGVAVLVLSIAWLWLWRQIKNLQLDFRGLRAQIERSSDDVAGLCSAAIAVDKRLSASEYHLNHLIERFNTETTSHSVQEQPSVDDTEDDNQGYATAIEKIRRGASVDELVKICGLTRDEAVLLMRLHGRK